LDHTGDLGIRVFGRSLPDLFRHAAEALFHVITDPETIRNAEKPEGSRSRAMAWKSS
jgi:SHS2 domain-containing protein